MGDMGSEDTSITRLISDDICNNTGMEKRDVAIFFRTMRDVLRSRPLNELATRDLEEIRSKGSIVIEILEDARLGVLVKTDDQHDLAFLTRKIAFMNSTMKALSDELSRR